MKKINFRKDLVKMKKYFKIWNYEDCSFTVSHYLADKKAIAIIIEDNITSEIVVKCTTYLENTKYEIGMATIKNYSENKGLTEILKGLGVVTEVFKSQKVNELAEDSETIDFCKINLKKLKEYAIVWHYEESEEK